MIAIPFHLFQRTILFFLVVSSSASALLPSLKKTEIEWLDSFKKGKEIANKKKRPLLLFFTGSDGCPWSEKMDLEIFQDPEFKEEMAAKLVFIQLEFPETKKLDETIQKQNEKLKKIYEIGGYPSLVLLDPEANVITKIGYLPVGGKNFADHIRNQIAEYYEIKKQISKKISYHEMEMLYERAKALGSSFLTQLIFDIGYQEHPGTYFLLEQYCFQLEQGSQNESIRSEIESRDPKNLNGSLYRLALLDFQSLVQKPNEDPLFAIQPLLSYVERFGDCDEEHLWKIEMMISQYLFTRGKLHDALLHARACYKTAPKKVQKDIADSIQYIRSELRLEERKTKAIR